MLRRYFGKISKLPLDQFKGHEGELVVDDETGRAYIMNGVTLGGQGLVGANNVEMGNIRIADQTISGLNSNANINIDGIVKLSDKFTFNPTGTLTIPNNGLIKYSNGQSILEGISTTSGNTSTVWVATENSPNESSTTQAVTYDSQGNALALLFKTSLNNDGNWLTDNRTSIVKFSPTGSIIWNMEIANGSVTINPWAFCTDRNDDLYIITQSPTENTNIWNNNLIKLSGVDGSIIWQKLLQESETSNNMQLVPMNTTVGLGFDGVVFAGTVNTGSSYDFVMGFVNSAGTEPSLVLNIGDELNQQAYGLAVNEEAGEIVFVGVASTPGPYYLEIYKHVIYSGVAWQKTITVDGTYNVQGTDVALCPDGNWVISATHNINSGSSQGIITAKINNTDGSVMWAREIANGCSAISSSIAVDIDGNIITSGSTYAGRDLVTGNVGGGPPAMYRVFGAYDSNGNVLWQKYFRARSNEWCVDNNWWNQLGSTGKTVATFNDKILLAGMVADWNSSNSITDQTGFIAQLTNSSKSEVIGDYDTVRSRLTDSAVSLTVTNSSFDSAEGLITLADPGSPLTCTTGSFVFVVKYNELVSRDLINGNETVSLESDGTITLPQGGSIGQGPDSKWVSPNENLWEIRTYNGGTSFTYHYNDEPVTWWDASNSPLGASHFRGAIIEYHAYVNGSTYGTVIGTIIVALDGNTLNSATHSENLDVFNNAANISFWDRTASGLIGYSNSGLTSGQQDNVMIMWTARVFYGNDFAC